MFDISCSNLVDRSEAARAERIPSAENESVKLSENNAGVSSNRDGLEKMVMVDSSALRVAWEGVDGTLGVKEGWSEWRSNDDFRALRH